MARKSKKGSGNVKKLLLALFILFVLIGCTKQPKTTIIDDPQYPFVDDEGRLNVDVSDYEFE